MNRIGFRFYDEPKAKALNISYGSGTKGCTCSNCGERVRDAKKECPTCGRTIDWTEDNKHDT